VFNVDVSAAAGQDRSVDFRNDTVAVTLNTAAETTGVDIPGVCFVIDLAGATADGCAGRSVDHPALGCGIRTPRAWAPSRAFCVHRMRPPSIGDDETIS
jgi:hypothetical protein